MNFQTKGGSLRIARTTLRSGELSFTLSIVRNMRIHGNPSHKCLAKIGTWKQSELAPCAETIYRILDKQVARLTESGVLWQNDHSFIETQINKLIPRPIPAPSPKSDYERMREMVAEVAARTEKKIKCGTGLVF